MRDRLEDERSPAERVDDIERMREEMRRAIQEALLQHKRAGNPVAVWRNGRVVWIPPADIPEPEKEAS